MPKGIQGFQKGNPGKPKGALGKKTRDIQEAARLLVESPEYQASLKARLQSGEAPHMEALLHHYAYGKPKDTVAIETPMRAVIVDLLAARRDD